jgi:glycosyltransferase involved in cell wall biosynthesis
MHYAVPRILSEAKLLERFYTDLGLTEAWVRMIDLVPVSWRPGAVRRLLSRVPGGIASEQMVAFNTFGCEYARRRRLAKTSADQTAAFLWAGREFCRRVLEQGLGDASGVYCFNSAGLEILQHAQREGRKAVMEQTIAPKRIEQELLEAERVRFPEWEGASGKDRLASEFIEREEAEWQASNVILCGSEFVREGIQLCGGPVEKCVVVPYGVDVAFQGVESRRHAVGEAAEKDTICSACFHSKFESEKHRPLRVLTVGVLGLRKGSPYVLQAAKQMGGAATFRMVGASGVTHVAQNKLSDEVHIVGSVPTSAIREHFAWADVFLLPSICEGSATATYEALAYGLPVICTPNTGSVVRDGVDGFIIPPRDVEAITGRLELLRSQPELRATIGSNARARAADFTVGTYGRRLIAALNVSPSALRTPRWQ